MKVFIDAIYNTLRNARKEDFNPDDYFWRIGIRVIENNFHSWVDIYKGDIISPTLYGIKVEIDYKDVDSIHLFEDITYKITT